MDMESIEIKSYYYYCGDAYNIDGVVHTKQLNSLSIVQAETGSYGIKIDNGAEYDTGEGGIFIAPSLVTQKITHRVNPVSHKFRMRFIFIDAIINKQYRIDDLFEFPVVPDKNATKRFDEDFDLYDNSENICDKMSCIYRIVKHLLETARERKSLRNEMFYSLTEFISENYNKSLTVRDMADFLNMSESNFYASFKKAFGISPIKYLNNYRLSVACEYLLQSDDGIQKIGESVGIYDQFYFSKMFKAKYSVSPQQYRKENRIFS